jgi:hypothetical protein
LIKKTTFISATLFALALVTSGCSSSSTSDEKPLGSVQAGAYTLDIAQEGSAVAPGAQTRFVMKATAGGKPTSITGWIGVASGEGSTKKLATFDQGDGDFDDDVVAPTPIPADAKFWFEIDTAGKKDVGSIAYAK